MPLDISVRCVAKNLVPSSDDAGGVKLVFIYSSYLLVCIHLFILYIHILTFNFDLLFMIINLGRLTFGKLTLTDS